MRIAFCGLMRSGKDTSADYFQQKHSGIILKFADPLYEMSAACFKIAGIEPFKHRGMLQYLGTEVFRAIDPNIWVNLLLKKLDNPSLTNIYCTDMRFANEEEALRGAGFIIVKLEAPQESLTERGAALTTHESERFMLSYKDADYTIINDGTLEDLHAKLDILYQAIQSSSNSSSISPSLLPKKAESQLIC